MAHPNFSDKNTTTKPPKLLDQIRDKLRLKHAPKGYTKGRQSAIKQAQCRIDTAGGYPVTRMTILPQTVFALNKPTWTGLNVVSGFMTSGLHGI